MEEQVRLHYPLGYQYFSRLREEGFLYVDKTDFVYKVTHEDSKYVLLTRPRVFGKTLFVTTLKSYFEGKKDLFKGLKIEQLEKDWTEYPVMFLSFCTVLSVDSKKDICNSLNFSMHEFQKIYGGNKNEKSPSKRLRELIKRAYLKTGKKVVVLIDEYDTPFSEARFVKRTGLGPVTEILGDFFQTLKDLEPYLKFVFFMGIMDLSKTILFSNFQNFKDISFDKEYAGVPGFTEEELLKYFKIGIEEFAKEKEISFDEMFEKIKAKYNGYHFSYPSPDIYVPWCVINAISNQNLWDYWFDTGNPHPLYDMMKKFNVSITDLVQKYAKKELFTSSILSLETFLPLLYQTGYLTVKGYNSITDEYLLDFPNKEVRIRLFKGLFYNFVKVSGLYHEHIAEEIAALIKEDKIEKALLMLNEHLSAVGLPNQNDDYYLQVLFIIFGLGGLGVSIEGRTPDGQTGIAIHTTDSIYTLGIKIDKSALDAIKLIDEMGYAKTIAMKYPRHKIFKLGINFQRATSTIKDFIIKPL